jgi:hypothetical protein
LVSVYVHWIIWEIYNNKKHKFTIGTQSMHRDNDSESDHSFNHKVERVTPSLFPLPLTPSLFLPPTQNTFS